MKNIGVWIDKDKALVVVLEKETERLKTILSNIEYYHPKGGSGTRLKGGPQDVVQDSKYLEREKHQLRHYFENIVSEVKTADALLIFGPAEANLKFNKVLKEKYFYLSKKVKAVQKANSMTENQVKAWVRDFFKVN